MICITPQIVLLLHLMKYKQYHISFTKQLMQKLWALGLLCSFFSSSGFVSSSYNQTPHIVQTEFVVSGTRVSTKKTFFYQPISKIFHSKSQQNYKKLITLHNNDTKRLLINQLKRFLSFKNNSVLHSQMCNTHTLQEEMPQNA